MVTRPPPGRGGGRVPPVAGPRGDDIRVMADEPPPADHGVMQPGTRGAQLEPAMNLLNRLWSRLAPTAGSSARMPLRGDAGVDDEPPCLGCGWFDSSHELQSGLHVSEHDDDEVVAATLPLATWLDLQLADWQPDIRIEAH